MTLVYGLCLPRKIYLVSDSRLTSSDGTFVDDFGKWLDLNPRLAVVAANSAHQASWILQRITREIRKSGMDWDFTQLETYLRENLEKLGNEYYATTGEYSRSVNFIFGGFEKTKKLSIEAGIMGEVMSMPVKAAGEGVPVTQSVDMEIINAFMPVLHKAALEGRAVEKGEFFEVDMPRPRVLAVSLKAGSTGTEVSYEDALCFGGVAFNPNYKTEQIELPPELLGELNFRDMSDEDAEKIIYGDYTRIIPFTHQLAEEKRWETVGGEITPLLVLPDATGIATGQHVRIINGKRTIGGIGQIDGVPHYYDQDGKMHPYRFIYGYAKDGDDTSSDAKL